MVTQQQLLGMRGSWVQFTTPWGQHRGIVERITGGGVLVRVPKQYAPASFAHADQSDEAKVDLALQQVGWGAPGYGYGPYGYGGPGLGYGYGPGRPGYGPYGRPPGYGWWAGAWLWWWLAFA